MSLHECVHDVPVTVTHFKLKTRAECCAPGCFWDREAKDTSREEMQAVKALAIHHAKARKHRVVVHLRQELYLAPRDVEQP